MALVIVMNAGISNSKILTVNANIGIVHTQNENNTSKYSPPFARMIKTAVHNKIA